MQLTNGALPLHGDTRTSWEDNKRDLVLWRAVWIGVKNVCFIAVKLVLPVAILIKAHPLEWFTYIRVVFALARLVILLVF